MPPKKQPKKSSPQHRRAFAKRLEAARVGAGYETMQKFAEDMGIEVARYRRWEAAETEPDLENLSKISELTGMSLDMLIKGRRANL